MINITGSPDFYPSNGFGQIFRSVSDPGPPYVLSKLTGDLLVLSVGGAANFYGANLCLGLWLENGLSECLRDIKQCNMRLAVTSGLLTIIPGGFPWAILARTHAVGAFWGVVNTTDVAGLSGSAFQYRLQST